jgi:amino acid transporter
MSDSSVIQSKKFGTFLGVFTPSVLTILGLIMYLRFGWVVGNVGLGWTLVIVILASSITFITGLSASAISTNMLVGAGGEYYMISRSLGLEPGGAIGIPLYFCRTLSVTFYCFGLAETLIIFWPESWGVLPASAVQWIAASIIIFITLLSGKSAELVLKAQIPILVFVGLSIIALFIGVLSGPLQAPSFEASYETAPEGFWYVFSIFFPAVTGFTAGIGMSGDLKDPKKSIPIGTLGAVIVCLLIYLLIPIAISSSAQIGDSELLAAGMGIENWVKLALFGGFLILPAVLGAILSSAFGSILNGPRVLQALSADGLAPKTFSKLSKSGQPAIATWVTGAIALLAVLLGELNTVAQLVSVLFLTLYVAINLSAAIEVIVAEPHYRPRIRVPWIVSMLGAIGAIFVMFLVSPIACIIALIIEIIIFSVLRKRSLEQNWGDVGAGIWLNIAKRALLNHSHRIQKPRNWRPQILLFSRNIKERIQLVRLAAAFSQSKGVLTISKLIPLSEHKNFEHLQAIKKSMQADIRTEGIEAFCEVNLVKDIRRGTLAIARGHGIAGLKSNTIMEGLSENLDGSITQLVKLRNMAFMGKNIIYTRFRQIPETRILKNEIVIWWRGKEKNADLMLLLGHLLRLDDNYGKYSITVKSILPNQNDEEDLISYIKYQLNEARIKAEVQIVVSSDSPLHVIKEQSLHAKVVFVGMRIPQEGQEKEIAQWLMDVSDQIENTVFVYNAGMSNAVPQLLI